MVFFLAKEWWAMEWGIQRTGFSFLRELKTETTHRTQESMTV